MPTTMIRHPAIRAPSQPAARAVDAATAGYGGVAKSLHWLIAALVAAQFADDRVLRRMLPESRA